MCGDGCNDCGALKTAHAGRDVNVLLFFEKRSFRYENDDRKKQKRNDHIKCLYFKNIRSSK